ncbi:MAG: F0F1 ATP synthase subunit epsilon [Acidobacteriota bacterium]
MTEKIELEIVTPEQLLFSGEVEEVVVPGSEGYLGILPGHAPLLSELQIGVISYRQDSQETKVFCRRGFVEVLPDRVSILAEAAELPDQIDVEQARAQQVEAEQQLRSDDPDTDYAQALLDLREAQIRLDLAEQSTAT